ACSRSSSRRRRSSRTRSSRSTTGPLLSRSRSSPARPPAVSIFVLQAFNGLSVGSILLLISLGLAFSFGLMNVINMAHGEMIMVGAYVAYVFGLVAGPDLFLLAI